MNELTISKQYPVDKYNLLGNTDVCAEIPAIKSPVIQVVKLDPDPAKGDVYIQQKAKAASGKYPATPNKYAITKNGLKKLADGAGIKMIRSEHVLPSTCQKCVSVNQSVGKVIQCGQCRNKDIAYKVTIAVPQLTGEIITVEDTHEIIIDDVTAGMTENQKSEFMKHRPQICEAKALNGAIRTALHIKGTYLLEELQKPFVVAYLVPNLNHQEVKEAAIKSMFDSSANVFGSTPTVQHIESQVPETMAIEAADDGVDIDQYVDGTYKDVEEAPVEEAPAEAPVQETGQLIAEDLYCDECGAHVSEKVWNYSIEKFGRPLCYKCQKGAGK